MSRLQPNQFGYTGFVCNCKIEPVGCWEPPTYPPMDCYPNVGPPDNRYLNFPVAFKGESVSGEVANYSQFHDLKPLLEEVYVPAGMDPDPFRGDYINLYQVMMDSSLEVPPIFDPDILYDPTFPVGVGLFDHLCYEEETCDQPEYEEGYLDVPVPFISFDAAAADPGMKGLIAVSSIDGLSLDSTKGLCLTYTISEYERPSGEADVISVQDTPGEKCESTTKCP